MSDLDSGQLEAINSFANRLIPEAFERKYSAYDISLVTDLPGSFDGWVEQRIDFALGFEYPFGGRPTGMIQVESGDLRGTWHGCTYRGCRLSAECERAQREVTHFDQPWMFAIDTWGPQEVWDEIEDEETGTLDQVLTYPSPQWSAPWYAEARGRGVARLASGIVLMDMWQAIGRGPLPTGTEFERHARRVLFRHPDRRRHRLR